MALRIFGQNKDDLYFGGKVKWLIVEKKKSQNRDQKVCVTKKYRDFTLKLWRFLYLKLSEILAKMLEK